jgi:ribosomal protein L34E
MKLILTEKEKCPKCGKDFECGKSSKCWCYELDVPASILERIEKDYEGCLCPECLAELTRYLDSSRII